MSHSPLRLSLKTWFAMCHCPRWKILCNFVFFWQLDMSVCIFFNPTVKCWHTYSLLWMLTVYSTLDIHRQIKKNIPISPSNIYKIEIQKTGREREERRGRRRRRRTKKRRLCCCPPLFSIPSLSSKDSRFSPLNIFYPRFITCPTLSVSQFDVVLIAATSGRASPWIWAAQRRNFRVFESSEGFRLFRGSEGARIRGISAIIRE